MFPPCISIDCPDIGVEEVPTTPARARELREFAIGRILRDRKYNVMIQPHRESEHIRLADSKIGQVLLWYECHYIRLVFCQLTNNQN
jgi:hypothetical protein